MIHCDIHEVLSSPSEASDTSENRKYVTCYSTQCVTTCNDTRLAESSRLSNDAATFFFHEPFEKILIVRPRSFASHKERSSVSCQLTATFNSPYTWYTCVHACVHATRDAYSFYMFPLSLSVCLDQIRNDLARNVVRGILWRVCRDTQSMYTFIRRMLIV